MRMCRSIGILWVQGIICSMYLAVMIAGCAVDRDDSTSPRSESGYARQADPPDPADSSSAAVDRGKQLFSTTGCVACHAINGQGGTVGPDLSNEAGKGRSRQWLTTQIRNPKANDPQTTMPAYGTLSNADVDDLVGYLLSLSTGKAGTTTGAGTAARRLSSSSDVAEGGRMWTQTCGRCHNLRPPSQYSDAQWQVAMHHMRVRVPLTGEQQRKVLDFLQSTN